VLQTLQHSSLEAENIDNVLSALKDVASVANPVPCSKLADCKKDKACRAYTYDDYFPWPRKSINGKLYVREGPVLHLTICLSRAELKCRLLSLWRFGEPEHIVLRLDHCEEKTVSNPEYFQMLKYYAFPFARIVVNRSDNGHNVSNCLRGLSRENVMFQLQDLDESDDNVLEPSVSWIDVLDMPEDEMPYADLLADLKLKHGRNNLALLMSAYFTTGDVMIVGGLSSAPIWKQQVAFHKIVTKCVIDVENILPKILGNEFQENLRYCYDVDTMECLVIVFLTTYSKANPIQRIQLRCRQNLPEFVWDTNVISEDMKINETPLSTFVLVGLKAGVEAKHYVDSVYLKVQQFYGVWQHESFSAQHIEKHTLERRQTQNIGRNIAEGE
jgi:hypothetical protein